MGVELVWDPLGDYTASSRHAMWEGDNDEPEGDEDDEASVQWAGPPADLYGEVTCFTHAFGLTRHGRWPAPRVACSGFAIPGSSQPYMV